MPEPIIENQEQEVSNFRDDEITAAFKQAFPKKTISEVNAPEVKSSETKTTPIVVNSEVKPDKSTDIFFDPTEFNEKYGKKYGKEIKEEKELQELFSAPTKTTELEDKFKTLEETHTITKKELDTLKSEYESSKESLKFIDIKKYFANEDLYKINQTKLKFPDKEVSVISDIIKTDLSKADPVDLLVKKAKFDDYDIYNGMDNSQIKEVIASDFNGVDLNDPDSWDNVTKAKINKAAKEARLVLETVQKVELPVPIDIEKEKANVFSKEQSRIEETKKQWSPIVDKMVSNFTELVIPDETGAELYKYTPELSDSFKAEISKFVDYLAYTGQPINEQTIMDVLENIKGRYIVKELPKIMKAHALSVTTKINDEWHTKIHNDEPLSTKTKPAKDGSTVWDKMESMV